MFLAGDIGGTKTVFALFELTDGAIRWRREERFPSRSYPIFEELLTKFLGADASAVTGACLGVAGLVIDGRCHATNLPWDLDERSLAAAVGIPSVRLLNDLEAAAYGMLWLAPEEMSVLRPSALGRRVGNLAIIAAGTGLGEAMLYWDGRQYHPIASEGGHADFGPSSPIEVELLQFLRAKFGGHVSWERVLSGPGLHNIYEFLREAGHYAEAPDVAVRLRTGDPNATIAELGLAEADPLSVATVDLFCSLYGAEAGNMALRSTAFGGVVVGGGIAPKLLPAIKKGGFLRAFAAKGRMAPLLETIEVSVALNPLAPLIGAARYALRT